MLAPEPPDTPDATTDGNLRGTLGSAVDVDDSHATAAAAPGVAATLLRQLQLEREQRENRADPAAVALTTAVVKGAAGTGGTDSVTTIGSVESKVSASDSSVEDAGRSDIEITELDPERAEFDCPICLKLLLEPVTVPCGHTFCRYCLARALEKPQCPMCRAPVFGSPEQRGVNLIIYNLIKRRYAEELQVRLSEQQEDEEVARHIRLPVFVLQDLHVFPGAPVMLRVFEPRYVTMIHRILETDRRFAMQSAPNSEIGVVLEVVNVHAMAAELLVSSKCVARYYLRSQLQVEAGTNGLAYADVETFEDDTPRVPADMAALDGTKSHIITQLRNCLDRLPSTSRSMLLQRLGEVPISDAVAISFWAARAVRASNAEKQMMLRLRCPLARLRAVNHILWGLIHRASDGHTAMPPAAVDDDGALAVLDRMSAADVFDLLQPDTISRQQCVTQVLLLVGLILGLLLIGGG